MCIGGGAPDVPAPIQYASVKTPTQAAGDGSNADAVRRRRAAASQVNVSGNRGVQGNAALAYKTALGQ